MSVPEPIDYTDARQMLADYADRRRRFFDQQNLVTIPEPVEVPPAPPPVAPKPVAAVVTEVPNFLALRPQRRDWAGMASRKALRPADSTIVLRLVVERFGVTRRDLMSQRRTAEVVRPRMIACWLMRKASRMSMPSIGRKLGGRDHTTVLSACRKIESLRQAHEDFRAITDDLLRLAEEEIGE